MTNDEFKCWLSGYLTLTDEEYLDAQQIQVIKNHAALVKAISNYLEDDIKELIDSLAPPHGVENLRQWPSLKSLLYLNK